MDGRPRRTGEVQDSDREQWEPLVLLVFVLEAIFRSWPGTHQQFRRLVWGLFKFVLEAIFRIVGRVPTNNLEGWCGAFFNL